GKGRSPVASPKAGGAFKPKDRMKPTTGRQRRFRITIRLSLAERQTLDYAAKRSGITRSALVRQVLLGVKPPRAARRPSIELSILVSVLDRLGGIASSLRAISSQLMARTSLALPEYAERELLQTLRDLRYLRPQLLRALGKRMEGPP